MKRLVLLGLLLLSACGPSGKAGPASSASAQVHSSAPAASPTVVSSIPTSPVSKGITPVTFACKLPIAPIDSGQGAFVTFPSGDLTIDPSGAFQSFGDELIKSVAQPYLYGSRFVRTTTFTRRYGRWLPASVAAVSPDSSHYAYGEFTRGSPGGEITGSKVHVVDVTSALDRVVHSQGIYVVLDYESEGVYLAATVPTGEGQSGLWLLDPRSGSVRAIAPQAVGSPLGFYLVGAGAAWYGDVAPGDQAPNGFGPMDRVLRFDAKSHEVIPWFRRPGMQVQAIGFDGQGDLVVAASTEPGMAVRPGQGSLELWLVTAPTVAKEIYSTSTSPDFVRSFDAPLSDSHGLWFGTSDGIFLYTPDGKFQKVSTVAGVVAGRCS